MGYVVHTCCICCTSELIGIKIAAVGGRATLSKTWKRRRWRIAHQANYQCWMENWWKLHLRVPIVPWCPHPHLQIGCWDRLWMTTKTLLRSAAWLWARLPAALTFARSDPSILVINVIKIPTHHISSLCPCPVRCFSTDIAFSCIFNQKLQGQVFQQQNCSRVSECCILSSRALALAACNCTDSCNSYTTMLLHWKENHRKTIALLQANLPCLLSKNGCTDTCVSYTMFSLSLLLTSVDVELLPPRTLAI